MISLPDFLRRLRRAWAPPGAPLARVAPPSDAGSRLRAEIAPLLRAISEIQGAANRTRTEARRVSAQLVDEATQEAERKTREAERSAPVARAEAAKRKRDALEAEIAQVLHASEREIARIDAASRERLPLLAEEVLARILSGAEVGP